MADTASPLASEVSSTAKLSSRSAKITIPPSIFASTTNTTANRLRSQLGLATVSPVNQNGSFEFDRVLKSGYVQKRTQKTKVGNSLSWHVVVAFGLNRCGSADVEDNISSTTTQCSVSVQVGQGEQATTQALSIRTVCRHPSQRPETKAP